MDALGLFVGSPGPEIDQRMKDLGEIVFPAAGRSDDEVVDFTGGHVRKHRLSFLVSVAVARHEDDLRAQLSMEDASALDGSCARAQAVVDERKLRRLTLRRPLNERRFSFAQSLAGRPVRVASEVHQDAQSGRHVRKEPRGEVHDGVVGRDDHVELCMWRDELDEAILEKGRNP